MLRHILMGIGILIALLPYLGFPNSVDSVISTASGLSIIILLLLARHGKNIHVSKIKEQKNNPHVLHVEHVEVEDKPQFHIEKKTVVDTEERDESPDTETIVEKKITTVRKRRTAHEKKGLLHDSIL